MPKLLTATAISMFLVAGAALAAPDATPSQLAKPAPTERSGRAPAGLMRYDSNKDGAVDRAEWKAGQDARFKQLDRNSDGKLTEDEVFSRTPAAASSVLPSDRQNQRQSTYFQLLDADKDGVVTLTEFMLQADRNFARCDTDKNDRIDTAECRAALQRRPAER